MRFQVSGVRCQLQRIGRLAHWALGVGCWALISLSAPAASLDTNGQWVAESARPAPAIRARAGLQLIDGSRLSGHIGSISNDLAVLRHRYFGTLRVATQELTAVRLQPGTAASEPREPGIRMTNGDWLPCRLLSASSDTLVVSHEGGTMPLPRSRCATIHTRTSRLQNRCRLCPDTARQFVRMRNGDVVAGKLVTLDDARIRLRRDGKTTWTAPAAAAVAIWSEGPGFIPITTLPPPKVNYTPHFDESFPVSYDRDPAGRELSLCGRLHARSVMCHPRTELVYGVDGKWTRFVTEIGLADSAPRGAAATFRVTTNGKTVFEKKVSRRDRPARVSIDLKGVTALGLVVDFGPNGSAFGAHAAWADPMLVK